MLNPFGSLSCLTGSLSASAGIGGAGTGASFIAASESGRPISGEPGGNWAGVAAGAAGCCARAGSETAKPAERAAAPSRARADVDCRFMMEILPEREIQRSGDAADGPPLRYSLRYLPAGPQLPIVPRHRGCQETSMGAALRVAGHPPSALAIRRRSAGRDRHVHKPPDVVVVLDESGDQQLPD